MDGNTCAVYRSRDGNDSGGDANGSETEERAAVLERSVREYVNGLPAVFDDSACVAVADDDARVRLACAGRDRDGLVGLVVVAEQRWRLALDELLDQEQSLSDALAEVRYLEGQAGDQEAELEMLRVQLQRADEYSEVLLREKADALRKLTEAKGELAAISAKVAGLQRDIDGRAVREKDQANSLASTPRSTAADTTRRSETPDSAKHCRKFVDNIAQLRKEIAMQMNDVLSEQKKRKSSLFRGQEKPRGFCTSSFSEEAGTTTSLHSSQRRHRRLGCASIEVQHVSQESPVVSPRSLKKRELETNLVQKVDQLAQKLHSYEKLGKALHGHFHTDASRSHEELLAELHQCRQFLSEMSPRGEESLSSSGNEAEGTNTHWALMMELTAALEGALVANEGLRAELECVQCDKKVQEISYELELCGRVIDMEELMTTLQKLREEVSVLKRRSLSRSSTVSKSLTLRESLCASANKANADTPLDSRGKTVSGFRRPRLSAASKGGRVGSSNMRNLSIITQNSVRVFNKTR